MSSPTFKFKISKGGTITAIYSDLHADLMAEGKAVVKRASHVEPNENGEWLADMVPVGGGVLGPFHLRQDALDAEHEFLNQLLF